MNAYFDQLIQLTSIHLPGDSNGSDIGGREGASWAADPFEVQEHQSSSEDAHQPQRYRRSAEQTDVKLTDVKWSEGVLQRGAATKRRDPEVTAESLGKEFASPRPIPSEGEDSDSTTPSELSTKVQRAQDEQAPSERSSPHEREQANHSMAARGDEADQPPQKHADQTASPIQPPTGTAPPPEVHSKDAASGQQWWAHVAQVRQWVAESDEPGPDPSGMIRDDTPAATHLPKIPHDQPEQDQQFSSKPRTHLPETGASEDVKLSIGSIQLTVEAPSPSPPTPPQVERSAGRSNRQTIRLSRHYLRR